ncbi:hypothetical protein GCM10022409_36550 [Hymenobacter glaciei]|uniref:Uncharacterized protein n=2 Tax=Hymenobacter glaciei TaxID=877209 RepID=A0ABP7ULX3_9BACT
MFGHTSCKKEGAEDLGLSRANGVYYYHFTDADRLWLQTRQGDEWRLENTSGYQRVYRANVVSNLKAESRKTSMGIPSFSKLLNYYDLVYLYLNRVDSLNKGGTTLRFYRDAAMLTNLNSGGYNEHVSQFYAEGENSEFVGNTDLISDYFSCRGMKFPRGAALNGPFQQLTVRGHTYHEVVAFISTARGSTCRALPPAALQELYYDRQAGLVRMVSQGGEVWERVL